MATKAPKRPSKLEQAQTTKFLAETAAAEALTRRITLEANDIAHEQSMREASEWENRIFVFDSAVGASSVQECMRVLGMWVRRDHAQDITVVFNSPGGSVFDGLALYDFIQQLREAGTRVDTTTLGIAASMGGILLQAGETRRMSRHSYLLIHEVSSGAHGKMSELEDELKFANRLQTRCVDILASRSKLSASKIKTKWRRKDWWLDAYEALDQGFCDEVE